MYIVFFVLAAVFLCIGVYKFATSYKKEDRDVGGQVLNLQTKKFSTDMNRFAAQKEMKPSVARTGLANQLSQEATKIGELGAAQARAIEAEHSVHNAPARLDELRQQEQFLHHNLTARLDEARVLKVSPEMLDQIRLKQEESQLQITAHQAMKEIDLQARWVELDQDLKSGFIYAQKNRQYLKMFQDYLFGLYEDRQQIQLGDVPAKEDKLRLLNAHIDGMEKDFHEQQKRLLQAPAPEDLQTGDEDTEGSRDD